MFIKKLIRFLPDLLFITLLSILSYSLVSFYSNANYINTGYNDWLVQAFRIKLLKEYGFTSWTHFWSNGINIWQSYQPIPHFFTLIISNLLHINITYSMILITITIFILVRLLIYLILRASNFSPFVSFACSILSLSIELYYGSMSDYALQFGIPLILVYVFLWKYYLKGKIRYLFPYLISLSFYIDPVVVFYAGLLWIFGLLFSEKKLISLSVLFEFFVFIIGSSWFFYPIIFKSSYLFSNPYLESLQFLAGETKEPWLGFSLSLITLFPFIFLNLFIKSKMKINWLKILSVYVLFCLVLLIAGTNIQLPYILSAFQFTRGIPMVAVMLCLTIAPIFSKLTKNSILKLFIILFIVISFAESMWINKFYAPNPEINIYDPVSAYIKLHPQTNNKSFFTPLIDKTSYLAPTTIHLPYSYMGHLDSNFISPRLSGLINYYSGDSEANASSINRIDNYLKVAGTQFVIFSITSPFTKAYLDKNLDLGFKNLGQINLPSNIFYIFKAPWIPHNAVLINNSLKSNLDHFPFSVTFQNNNDYIALDNYVQNFATTIYDPKNKVLDISYPTQESLVVKVPSNRSSNIIYIDESYSNDWKATLNGISEKIYPVGPNYMEVILDNKTQGGELLLKHSWPRNMIYLAWLIFLTPIGIGIYNLFLLFFKKNE